MPVVLKLGSPDSRRLIALEKAQRVRRARAELKRRVAQGERDVTEILLELPAEARTMTVADLLGSQRSWGKVRSLKALRSAAVPEGKQLQCLTQRQIQSLLGILHPRR
jgi:regulator of protease activity HflC (stomatin/prohibitin superfamily)